MEAKMLNEIPKLAAGNELFVLLNSCSLQIEPLARGNLSCHRSSASRLSQTYQTQSFVVMRDGS